VLVSEDAGFRVVDGEACGRKKGAEGVGETEEVFGLT
jgi:hypothetical protein